MSWFKRRRRHPEHFDWQIRGVMMRHWRENMVCPCCLDKAPKSGCHRCGAYLHDAHGMYIATDQPECPPLDIVLAWVRMHSELQPKRMPLAIVECPRKATRDA